MLEIWRRKARALGNPEPAIVHSEHSDYFSRSEGEWDLIVFSSVLHHLEEYRRVLLAAARNLRPGGVILMIFDPTAAGRYWRFLRRIDWILRLALHEPSRFASLLREKVGRMRSPAADVHLGRRVERHAYTGIDDVALVRNLRDEGLEVLRHDREYEARLAFVSLAFRLARRPSEFSLLARRPGGS